MPTSTKQLLENKKFAEQTREAQITARKATELHPNAPKSQIVYFIEQFRIPAAIGRNRSVSKLTTVKYLSTLECFLAELNAKGIKPKSLLDFTARHLWIAMREWEAQGKSSSTLANRFSVLARFLRWLGVTVSYKSVHEVLVDGTKGKRSTSVTDSKAWSSHGVDFDSVIAKLTAIDPLVALQLQLAAAFGLRVQEACAIRPIESDMGDYLIVKLGAKGGRGRTVNIESGYQRQILDAAKAHASTPSGNGFVRKRGQTIKSALNRFYYCMKLAEVNKKALGISVHGLRHEYANDLYTRITGESSPVNIGLKVAKEDDLTARAMVTEALGHSRLQITSAYLGTHRMMDRVASKRLAANNQVLTHPTSKMSSLYWSLQEIASSAFKGGELRLFLTGHAAEGKMVAGSPVVVGYGIYTQNGMATSTLLEHDHLELIASCCGDLLGEWCLCQHNQSIPASIERFELLFVK